MNLRLAFKLVKGFISNGKFIDPSLIHPHPILTLQTFKPSSIFRRNVNLLISPFPSLQISHKNHKMYKHIHFMFENTYINTQQNEIFRLLERKIRRCGTYYTESSFFCFAENICRLFFHLVYSTSTLSQSRPVSL